MDGTAPPLIGSIAPWTPSAKPARTPTPAPPTIEPGSRRPKILQKVSCPGYQGAERPAGWGPASAWGNTILAACAPWRDERVRTIALDATTGKIQRQIGLDAYAIAAAGAIWQTVPGGIRRIDLATGQTTNLPVAGSPLTFGLGYIWVDQGKTLARIDPITMASTTIPWGYPGRPVIACGFLWDLALPEYLDQDGPSTLTRVDLNTGESLAAYKSEGILVGPHQVEGSCLAIERLTAKMANRPDLMPILWQDGAYVDRLVSIDAGGTPERGPSFDDDLLFAGNTLWLRRLVCYDNSPYADCGLVNYFTRLNPATHSPVGPSWAFPQRDYWFDLDPDWYDSAFVETGGAIWVAAGDWLYRMDLPAGPLIPVPSPTAPPAPTPAPSV